MEHGCDDRGGHEHGDEENAQHDRDGAQDARTAPGDDVAVGRDDGLGAAAAALRPEDQAAGEQDEHPRGVAVGPQGRTGEEHRRGNGDEAEADERPRLIPAAAQHLGRDRVLLPLLGDHERGGEVDDDARAAEQGQDDEPDAVERGIDVEVARQALADPGEHPVRAGPLEPLHCSWLVYRMFGHASRVAAARPTVHRE